MLDHSVSRVTAVFKCLFVILRKRKPLVIVICILLREEGSFYKVLLKRVRLRQWLFALHNLSFFSVRKDQESAAQLKGIGILWFRCVSPHWDVTVRMVEMIYSVKIFLISVWVVFTLSQWCCYFLTLIFVRNSIYWKKSRAGCVWSAWLKIDALYHLLSHNISRLNLS